MHRNKRWWHRLYVPRETSVPLKQTFIFINNKLTNYLLNLSHLDSYRFFVVQVGLPYICLLSDYITERSVWWYYGLSTATSPPPPELSYHWTSTKSTAYFIIAGDIPPLPFIKCHIISIINCPIALTLIVRLLYSQAAMQAPIPCMTVKVFFSLDFIYLVSLDRISGGYQEDILEQFEKSKMAAKMAAIVKKKLKHLILFIKSRVISLFPLNVIRGIHFWG